MTCSCTHFSQCPSPIVKSAAAMRLCQDTDARDALLGTAPQLKRAPGVGGILAARIKFLTSMKSTSGCGCKTLAYEMDKMGPDGVRANLKLPHTDEASIVGKMTDGKHIQAICEHFRVSARIVSVRVLRVLLSSLVLSCCWTCERNTSRDLLLR